MFATSSIGFGTGEGMMTAQLIGGISTIIREVTQLIAFNTLLVGALILSEQIARFLLGGTQSHVVLIRTIAAVVHSITNLIASHTTMIGTLESPQSIAVEVGAHLGILIGTISTVVSTITQIRGSHTQVVVTLEARFGTITTAREAWRTTNLIGHIATITITITTEVGSNTVAGHALEGTILALITLTVHFIGVVSAVILMIALPA